MAKVNDLLDRHKALRSRHEPWRPYWQQLADVLLPNQADFTGSNQPGAPRGQGIYDGSPRLALRDLASTIDGLIKPKTNKWFDVAVDEEFSRYEEVKRWLETVRDRMWDAIYRTDARFIQRSAEVDLALCCFGWGTLWIQQNRQRNGLLFRSFHNNQIAIDENEEGIIDTISITESLSPRHAVAMYQRFDKNPHPDIMRAAADDKVSAAKQFEFVQIVLPNRDRQADGLGPRGMAFASALIDVKHETIVATSGFPEFPAAVPRWETAPGEVYPRSPGMMALPDAQTLQAMGKTLLVGGQRAVDPPIWVINDSVLSPLRTFPGGVTVLDASDAAAGAPVGAFPVSTNLPLGREMQNDYRRQVEAAFFKNVFNLPIETRQMTATEIIERKEEFIRIIGPVFGRLESDYIGHGTERVFGIMERAGAFPPRPDILLGQKVTFRFQSPIQQARKQLEIAGLSRSMTLIAPLAEVQPEIMDHFDGDAIVRDAPEWGGLPLKWLRTERKVEDIRAGREQAGQAQQTLAASGPVSQALKNVANADLLAAEAAVAGR